MKLLKKLPSLAGLLASRWFIGLAAAGLAGGSIWLYSSGQFSGYQQGYDRAEAAYTAEIKDTITSVVEGRDEKWSSIVEEIQNEINRVVEQNRRTADQERNLEERLADIQAQLAESRRALRDTYLGTCNLTPEFDSLFDSSAEADTGTGPTPSGSN